MDIIEQKLLTYAENNLNVLLIGNHGIGKSVRIKAISQQLGLKFKYYSSSTLDPFAELIGIPVPQPNKTIEFYRPHDLSEAEFIFFDELNRVTNPRVLQTVLEIIQFKSINGIPLKNLKMVWAAINPPDGDYQVEELDVALIDRFHVYIKMKGEINIEYMKTKMNEKVAKIVKKWWDEDMDNEQRRLLTPRRIEYIGWMIDNDVPWRDAIPQGHTFPVKSLASRISAMRMPGGDFIVDKDGILSNIDSILIRMKEDPQLAIKVSNCMSKFDQDELFECRDILETMPIELIIKVGDKKWRRIRENLKKKFTNSSEIDITKYPKISRAFKFEEF